jgi:eukaryotic-like serine/threonine-protein kinase
MDADRWQRIQVLFDAAVDLPEVERNAYVERECGGDLQLKADIAALLEKDAQSGSLFDDALPRLADELMSAPPQPPPLEQFGNYRILGELGAGGMGVVYLAERTDLGNRVAIKFLRNLWLSPSSRARFDLEQKTLAKLAHENIARINDAGYLPDGTPWFAMEYVAGTRLTDYCRQRRLTAEARLRLFRSVCDAVRHAHAQFIVHRDLKPSNILVTRDGTPKLLDFGIAKQIEEVAVADTLTITGARPMTAAYASPEQLRGQSAATSTDIYSLGVVLYELLTGRLPFDLTGCSWTETERLICEEQPKKPSVAALESPAAAGMPRLPKASWNDLDLLCLTALHKDPKRRYTSVETLIRDVDNYLNGKPLEALRDDLRYTAGKFVKRHRRSVLASAAVLAVLIALAVFDNVRLRRARDAAQAETARTLRVQGILTDLLEGGDHRAGPSQDLKVVDLLGRGVLVAQAANADPAIQADLFETLGTDYQALGNLDDAQRLLDAALEKRRSHFGEDSTEVAKSLLALGLLRIDQDRLPDAERFTGRALEMYRRHLPSGDPAIAEATVGLGHALEANGSYAKALEVLNQADRLLSGTHSDPSVRGSCLLELSNVQHYLQHWDQAEALSRQALAIWRSLYGNRHPYVADALINLGNAEINRGKDYAAAERDYREALDINRGFHGKDHPETAADMGYVAQALVYQGGDEKYQEAEGLAQGAVRILDRLSPDGSTELASALGQLGSVEIKLGKPEAAVEHFRRAADMFLKVNPEHEFAGIELSNLADAYLQEKQYARAEETFHEAIRLYAKTGQPESLNAGIAQIKLGRTLVRERRYREAEESLLSGYRIVASLADPSVSYLMAARQELIAVYDALHMPEKSVKWRAELEALHKSPTGK